jgi:DNA-directed RNA polymerase I subunit RPA1
MNYANCKSYNADFDGDEMNLHALQTYTAKAEAELCITDRIYANPTNGKPIRELIQDSIISAVYLTMKDTFLTKEEYSELLYQSTFALFAKLPRNVRIFLLKPAILRPKKLWTGKQLISNIMMLIVSLSDETFKKESGLTMRAKTKVPVSYLGEAAKE